MRWSARLWTTFGVWLLIGVGVSGVRNEDNQPPNSSIYQLKLHSNYTSYEKPSPTHFYAHLSFQFTPPENSRLFQMTASQLKIDELKIYDQSNTLTAIGNVSVFEDRWEILMADQMYANQTYKLKIKYFGVVNEQDGGFLITRYSGRKGEKRYLLSTNPTNGFSSVMPHLFGQSVGSLELFVEVPSEWTAVFNSIELEASRNVSIPRLKIMRFKPTPQMSFNNLLLVIGDLSSSIGRTKSGSMVRSFIPRDFDDFLTQTASTPIDCLSSAESYFEQTIEVDKIDHLNLLNDWSFAAPGIVVYPARSFSMWPSSPASDLLRQELLVCKKTIESWLSKGAELENGSEMFEALALFLSYKLVAEFEGAEYAEVVNEELLRLSNTPRSSTFAQQQSTDYPKHSPEEMAAILLTIEDTLGEKIFLRAIWLFVGRVRKQTEGSVFSTLIEAFQEATNYTPLCRTMMVRDFLNSWLKNMGPAQLDVSLRNGSYVVQQTSSPRRIVPLIVREVGGNRVPIQWLMPSGEFCYQIRSYRLDARIPYNFNPNGKLYIRVNYSADIHQLFIADGVNKMSAGAQFAYIRDLSEHLDGKPQILSNLLEFIGQSFTDTSVGSPLFVQEVFRLLHPYSNETDKEIEDILKRQIQNVHNSIEWQPWTRTIRNAILSEQLLFRSVLNQVAGSRPIADNFYGQFLKKCAPNFECAAFPVEILSAVLCNSVIGADEEPQQLLSQMINDLKQQHNLILYEAAERILSEAWQCVYVL